jgi:SOS response regulatory protein OraA/RecX
VPDEVVLRCGLAAGVVLDRTLLRRLRSELRHAEALVVADRALRRRDLSRHRLAERLERAGIPPVVQRRALTTLSEASVLDDARLARGRAASLADRGWGDAAIRERLQGEGIGPDEIETALGDIPPEAERAVALADRVRDGRRAWVFLARRGFDPDAIATAVGPLDEGEVGGLG